MNEKDVDRNNNNASPPFDRNVKSQMTMLDENEKDADGKEDKRSSEVTRGDSDFTKGDKDVMIGKRKDKIIDKALLYFHEFYNYNNLISYRSKSLLKYHKEPQETKAKVKTFLHRYGLFILGSFIFLCIFVGQVT